MNPTPTPSLAVIGGSGLYSFVEAADPIDVSTPFGAPSGPIAVGQIDGHPVAFLPRHGPHHELPPHEINYRANIWALRSLGVRRIIGPCAVGGLTSDVAPGDIVVPDQLVDRTTSRKQTYMDTGAVHAPFADPYCPTLRRALLTADPSATDGGTMVVIEGPRFSTRAESGSYRAAGWSLVNMTGHPEAVLARELGVCYAALALVTDMDAGVDSHDAVDQATVFAELARNTDRVRDVLRRAIGVLDEPTGCACASWLDTVTLPFTLP
ncbi:S-methyl-5'-thioadenosine phosphorylase [Sanguibacter sp. 25GB23B1]|uniref:S-methyl-5'-thioadenosine phosphorylase n=1 Tax=unclassified Sanguibacter TaxID=2645534 RepID=UPI0032AF5C61